MNAEQVVWLYRRLQRLFPLRWRRDHEAEFLDTLTDIEREQPVGALRQWFDLLQLALVLRYRQCRDWVTRPTALRLPLDMMSPATGVLVLAAVLAGCTLQWGQQLSIEFIATATVVVLVPGIGVAYTIANALGGGRDKGIHAATGCTLGILPHLIVAMLGLSGVMQLGAHLFEIVRWAGVTYLAWMGFALLRQSGRGRSTPDEEYVDASSTYDANGVILRGIVINTLNPKLTLFFFAFLPQFLSPMPTGSAVFNPALLGLGSVFMLLTLICFVAYAVAASVMCSWVNRSPSAMTLIERTFGVLLLGFATRLAVTDR